MRVRSSMIAAVALLLVGGLFAGCSKQDRQELVDDTVEAAARQIASQGGTEAFENEGIQVSGDLECTATSEGGASDVSVTCSGTGTDGEELAVEGSFQVDAGEIGDTARGSFVGTADGKEIFKKDCFGTGC